MAKEIPAYVSSLDYCTMSPDKLFGIKFNYACYLHDRQYRNEVLNRKTRKQADLTMRDMIYIEFKRKRKPVRGWIISRIYYIFVRLFGKKAWKK